MSNIINTASKGGTIQVARVGIADYEQLMKNTIRAALREDHETLRALEVKPYIPTTNEEADALRGTKGLLCIAGFLSLDGENGRAFDFNMEAGLTESEDADIAEQLAQTCLTCVRQLKKEHKRAKIRERAGNTVVTPKKNVLSHAVPKVIQ